MSVTPPDMINAAFWSTHDQNSAFIALIERDGTADERATPPDMINAEFWSTHAHNSASIARIQRDGTADLRHDGQRPCHSSTVSLDGFVGPGPYLAQHNFARALLRAISTVSGVPPPSEAGRGP